MTTFKELGLNPELLQAVEALGFTEPTKVQELAIPYILESQNDLVALAQTGTGKTGAFGLPSLHKVNLSSRDVQVLVLSPTRELAIQIATDLQDFSKFMKGLKIASVYGGANISTQIRQLNAGCQIVVGTPGRMLDLINRNKLDVSNVRTLILDEADEMLNMGFQEDLDEILRDTPKEKQTLLFSATMPKGISKIAKKYMNNAEEISVGEKNSGAKNVEHHFYMVHAKDRYEALKRVTDMNPEIYGIIFCRTRAETLEVANKLARDGYNADLLNGDLSQAQRDDVMNQFRKKELQILVATDVAARGLDVDNLTHVINYNLPDDLEVYIHRSGRTGRAGNSGISISIIHTKERGRVRQLEKMSGKEFIKKDVPGGEIICGIRLLKLLDEVQTVDINDEQIAPFLETAHEKLAELSREDLIKRFVSIEFNQFLEYYKDAADLNSFGRDRGNERNDRSDSKSRDRGERGDRGIRTRGGVESGYDRYFINVGRRDGLSPVRLMGVLNEELKGKKPDFGKIDIQNNFSFFEVETGFENDLVHGTKGAKFEGRDIAIEPAQPDSKSSGGGSRDGDSGGGRPPREPRSGGYGKSRDRKGGGGSRGGDSRGSDSRGSDSRGGGKGKKSYRKDSRS